MRRCARQTASRFSSATFPLVKTCGADEALLTGSFGAQTPAGEIDGRTIGNGGLGPLTSRIR